MLSISLADKYVINVVIVIRLMQSNVIGTDSNEKVQKQNKLSKVIRTRITLRLGNCNFIPDH